MSECNHKNSRLIIEGSNGLHLCGECPWCVYEERNTLKQQLTTLRERFTETERVMREMAKIAELKMHAFTKYKPKGCYCSQCEIYRKQIAHYETYKAK
jgi:hypothetical protein